AAVTAAARGAWAGGRRGCRWCGPAAVVDGGRRHRGAGSVLPLARQCLTRRFRAWRRLGRGRLSLRWRWRRRWLRGRRLQGGWGEAWLPVVRACCCCRWWAGASRRWSRSSSLSAMRHAAGWRVAAVGAGADLVPVEVSAAVASGEAAVGAVVVVVQEAVAPRG